MQLVGQLLMQFNKQSHLLSTWGEPRRQEGIDKDKLLIGIFTSHLTT